ncbi:hypothetical protein [Halorubrum sp. AJ67]|nr:hypothetical protein [Halorubrum sp. AJ67]
MDAPTRDESKSNTADPPEKTADSGAPSHSDPATLPLFGIEPQFN